MGWDMHLRTRELKQRRDSWIRGNHLSDGETPSPTGKSIGTEGKHLKLSVEGEEADLWKTGQSEYYRDGLYCGLTCPGLGHVFTAVQGGWELEHGDWRTGPG